MWKLLLLLYSCRSREWWKCCGNFNLRGADIRKAWLSQSFGRVAALAGARGCGEIREKGQVVWRTAVWARTHSHVDPWESKCTARQVRWQASQGCHRACPRRLNSEGLPSAQLWLCHRHDFRNQVNKSILFYLSIYILWNKYLHHLNFLNFVLEKGVLASNWIPTVCPIQVQLNPLPRRQSTLSNRESSSVMLKSLSSRWITTTLSAAWFIQKVLKKKNNNNK